ncbi:carboxymuconolactone decarboxylase family protein [soil metagenome]
MSQMPKRFTDFMEDQPAIAAAYRDLSAAVGAAGPLDAKTCAFVKLGVCLGAGLEGGAHSQARKALDAGATAEELRHAALQSLTTVGFPTMMRGLSWVDDVLRKHANEGDRP